jgi:two-component system sensor histidine kinase BarA
MLFNSLEEERRKILSACENNDIEALLGHVHYLHGATRYCGVPGLRNAAQVLETDIKSMLALHEAGRREGRNDPAPDTVLCREEVDMLLRCIDELVHWREHNPLPA